MENEIDPFTVALNYTQTPDFWLVVALPLVLLLCAAIIYFFLYRIKKRQEISQINGLENLKDSDVPADDEMDALEKQWEDIPEGGDEPKGSAEDKDSSLFDDAEEKWETADSESSSEGDQPGSDSEAAEIEDASEAVPEDVAEIQGLARSSWLMRLRERLGNTRQGIQKNLRTLFSGAAKIDDATLESLHETLYRADIGASTADTLVDYLKNSIKRDREDMSWEKVRTSLAEKITSILKDPLVGHEEINYPEQGPLVILIVGVNGVGKTTSIGKLASYFLAQQKSVLLCAGDTFRAAAIEQLRVWGDRLGVEVISHKQGGDPAAVAYDGVKAAMARNKDVLLIDTAGRLHNKEDLMKELGKITKVIKKDLPDAPHETWLVIDATTGQNAFQQVKAFKEVTPLSGLVVTKLDGTAKGGVVIGVCHQFKIPIRFIGIGEKAVDLQPFVPEDFSGSLFDET